MPATFLSFGTELAIYAIKALYLRLFAQGGGTRKNRR